MDIKISIIVPVYNLEKLLPRCVDSILCQTFNEFELILVNDGSTDRSGELCDGYAKIDSRVRVIHKKNGGVASTRNAGLRVAKGNYIGFADNDDFVNRFLLEELFNNAKTHASDIVICDYVEVEENQFINRYWFDSGYLVEHFNSNEALNQLYTTNNITFVVPWNKLYKKLLFEDIRYEEGNINDDETVAHKLLYNSHKVTYIHTGLYYYVQRKGSQTNSSFKVKRLDAVYALKQREVFFRTIKDKDLHQKALKHYMEKFFWYYFLAKSSHQEIDKELKKLKRTFDRSLLYLLRHRDIGWKQKVLCVVFSINPSIFEFIKDAGAKQREKQQQI